MSSHIDRYDQLCKMQKTLRDACDGSMVADTPLMLGFYCAEIVDIVTEGHAFPSGGIKGAYAVATINPNTDLGGIASWCFQNLVPFQITFVDESNCTIKVEL